MMNSRLLFFFAAAAVTMLSLVAAAITTPTWAQEDEERNNVIEMAEVKLITCKFTSERESTGLVFWQQKQCDHDILFLKGLCEASNNTAYPWRYSGDMERYLNDRGLVNAPRPPDIWCNIDIDGCIQMNEEAKAGFQEMGDPESESTQNLVEHFDEEIQRLEDMKEGNELNDNSN
jgi:hypothetical protein